MILSITTYKSHLPPNTITDGTKFDAFETRALYKFFPKFLGDTLVDLVATGDADDNLMTKIAAPLANLTYLLSIPFFNVVLTSTGFGVVSNPNVAPASVERIKDLKEACLQAANDGMDQLLKYLEENYDGSGAGSEEPDYSSWNACSLNDGHLITDASEFSSAIGFTVKRHLFVDLIEHINRLATTSMASLFSAEYMDELIEDDDEVVRPLIIKALANFAWKDYQDVITGSEGKAASPHVKFQEFGTKYANRALTILIADIDSYPTFEEYGYEAPYENSDDEDEDGGGFFIGGLTAQ